MKTKLVKIGNSVAIRLPKSIIGASGVKNEVEIVVGKGQIIIKLVSTTRTYWDAAFKKMAKRRDDILLDNESIFSQSEWDQEEWTWYCDR